MTGIIFNLNQIFKESMFGENQQTKYIEFLLRGGKSANVIYFNKPSWQGFEWYIDLNTGGTPHTEEEINKVKELLQYL